MDIKLIFPDPDKLEESYYSTVKENRLTHSWFSSTTERIFLVDSRRKIDGHTVGFSSPWQLGESV